MKFNYLFCLPSTDEVLELLLNSVWQTRGDEVLLNDSNDSEFSGFGPEDVEPRSGSSVTRKQKEAKLKKANKTVHASKEG